MKRGYPPVWLGILILTLVVFWRMAGAPVTVEEFGTMETPFWQMRVLAPARMARILRLWFSAPAEPASDLLLREDAEEEGLSLASQSGEMAEKTITVWLEDGVRTMPLESYVCGVVAAEMPAAYHLEALKAQAVAARTRAVRQQLDGGCSRHPGADICGDSACCQGYVGEAACREKWGGEFELYRKRVMQAALETRDELLRYDGEPITVMYHAMSGGHTEDVQAVFSQSLPYLVSVDSAGAESARGFYTDATFSYEEAARLLNAYFSGLNLTAQRLRQTFSVAAYTDSGRVKAVVAGEHTLDAAEVRRALSLRSTLFSVSMDETGITFHQRGYGHGVGMSQVGANSMAADGADHRAILAHYYPGTELGTDE